MATHSSLLAWRITRTEEPGRLHTAHSDTKSDMADHTGLFAILSCEGYADDGLLSKKKHRIECLEERRRFKRTVLHYVIELTGLQVVIDTCRR